MPWAIPLVHPRFIEQPEISNNCEIIDIATTVCLFRFL